MKASTVIPAYNEELTITEVVKTCKLSPYIDDVIVVDDGSSDHTAIFAEKAGADVIRCKLNRGKAYAVMAGVKAIRQEIVLLLDADLTDLRQKHVDSLVTPVLSGSVVATVGLFTKGRMKTDLAHTLSPGLSGQRCLHKSLLLEMEDCEDARFGFEICLNTWMKKQQVNMLKVPLEGVSHLTKEEKRGKKEGFSRRMEMYEDIMNRILKKKET